MKNPWKMLKALAVAMIILSGITPVRADKNDNLEDLSFAELVNSVNLGKQGDLIRKFQDKEAKNVLLRNKWVGENSPCAIDAVRNKEVLVVTIPANLLFGPNQTELLETADKYLEPFKRYLKEPDLYRVLTVMHTDNTGSEAYREQLTVDRAQAVADWFENNALDTSYLFPFAMADDMPMKEKDGKTDVKNDSYVNRERNRRLEIYLVPGEAMVDKAKKGRIAL